MSKVQLHNIEFGPVSANWTRILFDPNVDRSAEPVRVRIVIDIDSTADFISQTPDVKKFSEILHELAEAINK